MIESNTAAERKPAQPQAGSSTSSQADAKAPAASPSDSILAQSPLIRMHVIPPILSRVYPTLSGKAFVVTEHAFLPLA